MSSADTLLIHPSLPLIFPLEESMAVDAKPVTDNIDPDAAWHFYSHSIRRNPKDLALHTHRIFFAMRHKDAEFLAGSLHDLFYVLKDAGENLRIRLLKAAMPHMDKKDILYFVMWIKTGIKKGMGYKWVNGSVLTDGLEGPDLDLITIHSDNAAQAELAPLEEARSCMEYGQFDLARKILQRALEENSDDSLLLEELAYLNQYAKSREIQPVDEGVKNKLGSAIGKLKGKIFG